MPLPPAVCDAILAVTRLTGRQPAEPLPCRVCTRDRHCPPCFAVLFGVTHKRLDCWRVISFAESHSALRFEKAGLKPPAVSRSIPRKRQTALRKGAQTPLRFRPAAMGLSAPRPVLVPTPSKPPSRRFPNRRRIP